MNNTTRILQPGRNCWRIRRADRVAFLVDGDAYFRALYSVLGEAEQQVLITSWDIYSGIRIGALDGDKSTLAEKLDQLLHANRRLHTYMLNWDFSILFAMSREWLPVYKFGWKTHPRLKFKLDSQHPTGASHHQKFVVLDDAVAFSGGLDITRGRWDTPQHFAHDKRRLKVDGTVGRPYHDVQIAISGEAAAAMGDLFRERWRRATDEQIEPPDIASSLWPKGLNPDLEQVDVAISRTEARYASYDEVREVEQLYLDSIVAAQNYIYIENQFFTSPAISHALTQRLLENDGPEIVINLPLETEGWLSQKSLDVIRVKLLQDLRKADKYNRLAVYYPYKKDLKTIPINLHAKVMIVDDRFVRVGSSNLNNRSMGLDSECDISIETRTGEDKAATGIAGFRDRLLAEHFETDVEHVRATIRNSSSLIEAIESMRERNPARALMPLESVLPEYEKGILTDAKLVDPEEPINPESLLYHFFPEQQSLLGNRRIVTWISAIVVLMIIAGVWRFTGLGEWLEVENLAASLGTLRDYPFSVPLILAGFILAGILMVPVTVLIIASIIVFGPWWGAVYAMIGAVSCSILTYLLGSLMGRDALKGLAGGRVEHIGRKLARHGVMTITFVRIVPVAPFTVINLIAGASHIHLRDFTLGTVLGLIPGITAFALLTDRIRATVASPDTTTIILLLLVIILIAGMGYGLSRYLRFHQEDI